MLTCGIWGKFALYCDTGSTYSMHTILFCKCHIHVEQQVCISMSWEKKINQGFYHYGDLTWDQRHAPSKGTPPETYNYSDRWKSQAYSLYLELQIPWATSALNVTSCR